jgi:hypothetical protein
MQEKKLQKFYRICMMNKIKVKRLSSIKLLILIWIILIQKKSTAQVLVYKNKELEVYNQ